MVSTRTIRHIVLALTAAHSASAQAINALSYVGCYSKSDGLSKVSVEQFQTEGLCQKNCVQQQGNKAVLGLTNKDTCYCGDQVPPTSAKVDDSLCNLGCNGFGTHSCGGTGYYTVYLTGAQSSVSAVGGGTISANGAVVQSVSSNGASSATSSAGPTVVTSILPGQTVTTTATANNAASSPDTSSSSSGPNIGAIVGGIVGGIIGLVLIGALVFFIRRRKQQRAAEEQHRANQVADFMSRESKSSSAMTGSTATKGPDSRFDAEAMAHRRLSDGSIADNEDYSRRILKVTNA